MTAKLTQHWRLASLAAFLSVGLLTFHYITGTVQGASFHYNLSWYEAFRNAFWQGDLYPRFLPDLWHGMGGADFYFYGPMPFWFTATFGEAVCPGCSTSQTFSVSAAWMMILSGVTFFIFARRFFKPAWAGFGAILYVFLPMHYLVTWYVAQTVGTVLALAILPLLALSVTKLIEENKGGVLFSASFTALALTHLPSTLLIGHLLVVCILWAAFTRESDWRGRFALVMRFAPWGLLSVALSAVYWLPALALLDTVSSEMLYTSYYDATKWLFFDGLPENDPYEANLYKWPLFLAVFTAVAAGSILYGKSERASLFMWVVVPSLLVLFLMSILSYPVWKFWIINKVQFPYRSMVLADLSIAVSAIVIVRNFVRHWGDKTAMRSRLIAAFGTFALFFAVLAPLQKSSEVTAQGWGQTEEFLPVAPPEYIPPRFIELALERFRAKVTDEDNNAQRYLMFFEEMRLGYQAALNAFEADAPGSVLIPHINERMTLIVDLPDAQTVRIPLSAWTFWRAELSDGTPVELRTNQDLGVLEATLPAGSNTVNLSLIETAPQRIGSAITFFAILVSLFWGGLVAYRRRRGHKNAFATSIA